MVDIFRTGRRHHRVPVGIFPSVDLLLGVLGILFLVAMVFGGVYLLFVGWVTQARRAREADIELSKALVKDVSEAVAQAIVGRPANPTETEDLARVVEDSVEDIPEEHVIPDHELDEMMFPQDTTEAMEGALWNDPTAPIPQPPD
jgi:hypothetical protein